MLHSTQLNGLCPCLWLGPISKLVCPVSFFVKLVLQACSTLVGFMEFLGTRKPSVSGLLGFCLKWESGGWELVFFPLAPVQVSIVQPRGFILCTHLILSLLGALLWKRKINRLWSINGLPFKYQRLLCVRQKRPVGVTIPLQWFSRPKLSSLDSCYAMTCACTNLPIAQDTGRWVEKLPRTPLRSVKQRLFSEQCRAVETAQKLLCSVLSER